MSCFDVLKRDKDGNRLVLCSSNCQSDSKGTLIFTNGYIGSWWISEVYGNEDKRIKGDYKDFRGSTCAEIPEE